MKISVIGAAKIKIIILVAIALVCPAFIFFTPTGFWGTVVIDAGHGGIDGGANKDGILEKNINLDIAGKVRPQLEQNGYAVVMTREEDVALDPRDQSGRSRHQRDLNARANAINASGAMIFLSIHVNWATRSGADGSIVYYGKKFPESLELALCIQRKLNAMSADGHARTVHEPQTERFFLLGTSEIPGVLIETAFLSNPEEFRLLCAEEFRSKLADAIAAGTLEYLNAHKAAK